MLGFAVAFAAAAFLPPEFLNSTPPPEHIARYGPPKHSTTPFFDALRLWAFPAGGTLIGLACRLGLRPVMEWANRG